MVECIRRLVLKRYGEDGLPMEGKYIVIPVGSRWIVRSEEYMVAMYGVGSLLGNDGNMHLDRVWKTKKAKTSPWVEVSRDTLSIYFKRVENEVN